MKPKTYRLVEQCVWEGVARGVNRAHKHTSEPTHTEIANEVSQAVMAEIAEWFTFEELEE